MRRSPVGALSSAFAVDILGPAWLLLGGNKRTSMKFIYCWLLIGLLICTNGCISSQVVKRAKGYTTDRVEPRQGDTVFLHGGSSYVVQQKRPERDTAEKMSPTELQKYPPPYYAFDRCRGCYSLFLITAPMDAATLPFQAIGYGLAALMYSNATHF
jgi:hypothetical protein